MKLLFALLAFCFCLQAKAALESNPHAPSMEDIVLAQDRFEKDWSPFFFHYVAYADVLLDLVRDPSCPSVSVRPESKTWNVFCNSPGGEVKVGTLRRLTWQHEDWNLYQVNWLQNIELAVIRTAHGLNYTMRLKN